jgi:hypothetical protein
MITPSFSLAATEPVFPRLSLNFTTTVLDPRVTFTRSTTGRFYNATSTAIAEQNLLTYSQQFDQWTSASGPITVSSDVLSPLAPDGTATADKIIPTASNFGFRIKQSNAVTTTGTSLLSVYVQAGGYDFLVAVVTGAIGRATINFATGAITNYGTNSFTLVSSVNVIGSWYRVVLSIPVSIPGFRIWLGVTNLMQDPLTAFTGNGTSGIFFWGAQLENRSTVTAYTATTTAAITNTIPVLETAAIDAPRFDHNPITRASLGLLIEEARTNLLTYSDDFANAAWTKTNATIASNTIVAPDGTITGDKLVDDTANSTHEVSRTPTVTTVAHTLSAYAKAGEKTWLRLVAFQAGLNGASAYFNLSNGTIGTVGVGATATITSVGNGWYRCSITYTPVSAGFCTQFIRVQNADNVSSYIGNGFDGIFIWGAQLEVGAFQTSYIPTVASTVARNDDVATMTGTNFSDWYNSPKGTFRVDAISPAIGNRPIISADDDSANNSLIITTDGTAPKFIVNESSSEIANVSAGTITANSNMFAYTSYDVDYFGIARPTARQVDTSGTVPTVDRLRIGRNQAGNYLSGHIQQIQFWP